MLEFPSGTKSPFARMIAAEVRARIAAARMGQRELASDAGFASHNYLAIRLRDERPFTLDDVEQLCTFYEEEPKHFIETAVRNQADMVYAALDAALAAVTPEIDYLALAADDQPEMPEGERLRRQQDDDAEGPQ